MIRWGRGEAKVNKVLLVALAGLSAGLLAACGGGHAKIGAEEPAGTAGPEATASPGLGLGKLAYVQGGDIWVKALPDGEPLRLTTDGRSSEPRWSPSGEWLALRKGDEQAWVMRADGGSAHRLDDAAYVTALAWAPTSDRLAFVAGGALKAVDSDGLNEQELVAADSGGPGTGVQDVAWSPDGGWLAYDRIDVLKPLEDGRPPERHASVWRVRADGSGASELVDAGTPSAYGLIAAGWSPDAQYVLYWIDPQFSGSLLADGAPLYSVPAEGGTPVQLAATVLLHPDFLVPGPAGTDRVAVVVGGFRVASTNKALHVLSASGRQDMALTSPDLAASSPAWSPDGRRIAYVAMPDEQGQSAEPSRQALMKRRIFAVDSQGGSGPQQLTDDPAYRDEYPLWSADGSFILFARLNAEDQASLWLVPEAGGEPRQIVDELSPAPQPSPLWFGYYGHVDWDTLFDWWRGPAG
jgi:Tol biopolymer transport system component